MTAFVIAAENMFNGSERCYAGKEGNSLVESFWSTVGGMKTNAASSSAVFHELETLAHEQGTSIHDSVVMTVAQRFLLVLPRDLPQPELDLDNDGDVLFDWCGPNSKMFTLALAADGRISYAARLSQTSSRNGNDLFLESVPTEISDLVRRVIN